MTSPHLHPSNAPAGPLELTDRVRSLDATVRASGHRLCAERALLVTEYFRDRDDRSESMVLRKGGALRHLLGAKRAFVHDEELLVGSFTSHRLGGQIFPELHGVAMLEDLLRFDRRRTNRFEVAEEDRRRLLREVIPYWAPRMLALHAFPLPQALRFIGGQLSPTTHLINETGGISHFVPDYERLLLEGTEGLRHRARSRRAEGDVDGDGQAFLRAVDRVCDGLEALAANHRREALRLAASAPAARRRELAEIARVCERVPRKPARTFHEGLQAILFAQIAINLESLDNAVCPGRLDQILQPLYAADLEAGRTTPALAYELLGCFAVKLCEIVPLFSERVTRFHGGLFNGQVVVVGGLKRDGSDATTPLTHLFLELMDALRTRQPNYHARIHGGSPPAYRERIARALARGAVSPAVYNDDVIVPIVRDRGVREEDAFDYATVGCVEPVAAGRSFWSTDAALFNYPMALELALHRGRRPGQLGRTGERTPPVETCRTMEEVVALLETQLSVAVGRMIRELRAIERANTRLHPTPLSSMLLRGCIESATDSTAGGAEYNGSGIQGVGVVEVGESLAALEHVVFRERRATMAEVVEACRRDFRGAESLAARLRAAPKYGNDDPLADRWVSRAMELFADAVERHANTRGGPYVAGFYSVTTHVPFGERVGALPSGRRAGRPYSSGISPSSGADRRGPTAAMMSQASLPLERAKNGVNFNLQLSPTPEEEGTPLVQALIAGAFQAGCMQLQLNVLDPQVLIEARDHPGSHPGLLVRVSGYSAYFDDLSSEMQQEIIDRMLA